eukprot:2865273-Pyramimonas_sp.AAC.1
MRCVKFRQRSGVECMPWMRLRTGMTAISAGELLQRDASHGSRGVDQDCVVPSNFRNLSDCDGHRLSIISNASQLMRRCPKYFTDLAGTVVIHSGDGSRAGGSRGGGSRGVGAPLKKLETPHPCKTSAITHPHPPIFNHRFHANDGIQSRIIE